MTRQRANFAIVHALYEYLLNEPDVRFGQALVNLDIVVQEPYWDGGMEFVTTEDPYNEEPTTTLERVKQRLVRQQQESL